MANEGSLTFSFTIDKIPPMVSVDGENLTDFLFSVSSGLYSRGILSPSASVLTAVPMGAVTVPGLCLFINTDTVNFVTVYNTNSAAAESKVAKLMPGQPWLGFVDAAFVPYAKFDTLTGTLLYYIASR